MKYHVLKPYPVFRVTAGKPLTTEICPKCRRPLALGQMALEIVFDDDPPYPDAISALDGPEWAGSTRLIETLARHECGSCFDLAQLRSSDGEIQGFQQIILLKSLAASGRSISGGVACSGCGRGARLRSGTVELRPGTEHPALARLHENPYVVLVRDDMIEALRQEGMDIESEPANVAGV